MMKFNERYQPADFLQFLQEFLPEDFSEKEEDIVINKERYKVITGATVLGYCGSLDLYVLEMDHSREKDPRVTITTDAFKILADNWIHRALVIFTNKDTENYRLSYLTITLDLNDKNKAVKKYSNARRYSFYLGANAKVRTPEQQLIKKGRIKDIDDLLHRFSVEVVNKQFYLEVAKFFDELVSGEDKNLLLPGVSQEDVIIRKSFAVRLIGRLMFCWFLKQKKSSSGQLIPDEILSSDAARKTNNYYHDILEPLFFEVLNTSIDTRGIRNELFDKVPYLNGGLFNPQSEDFYELDRDTFFSKHINTLSICDQWFVDFFKLLELYNFTIDENTVFDQELSVDPEMLGRIFENLLAEINPETGSSERKRTGSFYTPRQIVEYMVDQSLMEYFKTKTGIEEAKLSALVSYDLNDDTDYPLSDDEKQRVVTAIETLKLLDPACGSGAYPIGALQKIVYILQAVDPDCKLWLEEKLKDVPDLYKQKIINEVKSNPFDYTRKLDVIKNAIFGVDIQPIAVDVSRLRCFLTLVVESEIDDAKPNRGIEPLPNLDFKFVCANTLIGLPKAESNGLFDDHSGIFELSKIMSEYFSCNSQRKNEIRLKFLHVQKDILGKTISAFGKSTGELTLKLTTWNPFSNTSNSWFDPEWMFGIEGKFDIVIGNPPYGILNKKQNKSKSIVIPESELNYYKTSDQYKDAMGGMINIYKLFVLKSIDLLKSNGIFSEIFPLAFAGDLTASKLRRFVIEKTQPISIDAFPERDNHKKRVFEGVKMSVCILVTKKCQSRDLFFIRINKNRYVDLKAEKSYISPEKIKILDEKNHSIPLTSPSETELLIRVFLKSIKFSSIGSCNTGEVDMTFCKEAFTTDSSKPSLLKGAIIGRYVLRKKMSQGEIVHINEEQLSKIKNIEPNLKNNARIVLQGITGVNEKMRLKMMIVSNVYCANSLNYLDVRSKLYDLTFLLGVFNSKLMNFVFSKFSTNSNVNGYEVDNLPIPKDILAIDRETVSRYVSEILERKSVYENDDTSKLENQIDELVMDLYGLNDKEKEIIRNA